MKMKKRLLAMLGLILIFSICIPLQSKAAYTSVTCPVEGGEPYMISKVNHGWTTFKTFYKYVEDYSITGATVIFTSRSSYVTVWSNRAPSDTPYTLTVNPIEHLNSNGSVINTFKMTHGDAIFPGGLWKWEYKINQTPAVYSKPNLNKGKLFLSIFSTGCNNPYYKNIQLSLNVLS